MPVPYFYPFPGNAAGPPAAGFAIDLNDAHLLNEFLASPAPRAEPDADAGASDSGAMAAAAGPREGGGGEETVGRRYGITARRPRPEGAGNRFRGPVGAVPFSGSAGNGRKKNGRNGMASGVDGMQGLLPGTVLGKVSVLHVKRCFLVF